MKCTFQIRTDVDELERCDANSMYLIGLFLRGSNESKQIHQYCDVHTNKLLRELADDPRSIQLLTVVFQR